jgi:hypothetical protein
MSSSSKQIRACLSAASNYMVASDPSRLVVADFPTRSMLSTMGKLGLEVGDRWSQQPHFAHLLPALTTVKGKHRIWSTDQYAGDMSSHDSASLLGRRPNVRAMQDPQAKCVYLCITGFICPSWTQNRPQHLILRITKLYWTSENRAFVVPFPSLSKMFCFGFPCA